MNIVPSSQPMDIETLNLDEPDVDNLVRMEIAEDGIHATLTLFDAGERRTVLALPMVRLMELLAALPGHRPAAIAGDVLVVRSWTLASDAPGPGVRLALQTPGGRMARFRVLADRVAGIGPAPGPLGRATHQAN